MTAKDIAALMTPEDGHPAWKSFVKVMSNKSYGHDPLVQAWAFYRAGWEKESVADTTWRQGILHLTVDADGLVSLWDHEMTVSSYLRLELTPEQQTQIQATMDKKGYTP